MNPKKTPHLDPSSDWVLDLADLPRSPGSERPIDLDVTLAENWGSDVAGIEAGRHVSLTGTLDSVLDGVFLSAAARAQVDAECVRCLDAVTIPVDTRIDELFLYPEAVTRAKDDGDEEAEELPRVTDNYIDIEQVVRDAILGDLPFSPLCREDCEGLCPDCGIALRDAPADHHHETIDPRWSALSGLASPRDDEES